MKDRGSTGSPAVSVVRYSIPYRNEQAHPSSVNGTKSAMMIGISMSVLLDK